MNKVCTGSFLFISIEVRNLIARGFSHKVFDAPEAVPARTEEGR